MIDKLDGKIVGAFAAAAGFITGLYGGWTRGSRVLIILMLIDYVLGIVCALTGHSQKTETGHFLSQVAFAGLLKKGVIMLVILVAAQLDKAVGTAQGGVMFRSAAEFFYIATEGLSIVENAGLMGVPIPKFLRKMLEALRDKNDAPEGNAPREDASETEDDHDEQSGDE